MSGSCALFWWHQDSEASMSASAEKIRFSRRTVVKGGALIVGLRYPAGKPVPQRKAQPARHAVSTSKRSMPFSP